MNYEVIQDKKIALSDKKLLTQDTTGFVEILETFGDDITIVNAARVSFHKESQLETITDEDGRVVGHEVSSRDQKLINYLADHDHITPFFHPAIRFRLKMPFFIARQWFKHTIGFARNEVSRRYVDATPEIHTPAILRERDANLKQGSRDNAISNNDEMVKKMKAFHDQSLAFYQELIDNKVCPEQARIVLPNATYTEFIETGSLSAYARLVKLRCGHGAQKEIAEYAALISKLIAPKFPVGWHALVTKHLEQ